MPLKNVRIKANSIGLPTVNCTLTRATKLVGPIITVSIEPQTSKAQSDASYEIINKPLPIVTMNPDLNQSPTITYNVFD
uniref:Uncharacterized protein n=1 Tax=Glossina palpalis gambiensis TaxID=67801 RepID=A0A1B0ATW8_9MUSC